jgi:IS5 family transposase
MKGSSPDINQSSFLMPGLKKQLDPKHPIYQLNDRINWSAINEDFKELYSHTGRPAKSVRLMVSLLLLKQLDDLSDEQVIQRWVENPYCSFCVERLNFSGNLQ